MNSEDHVQVTIDIISSGVLSGLISGIKYDDIIRGQNVFNFYSDLKRDFIIIHVPADLFHGVWEENAICII